MLPLILANLALSGVKYGFDKAREDRDRELNAKQTELSAWTKRDPSTFQQIREADLIGTLMQGAMTGAALGQNMEMMDLVKKHPHQAQVVMNPASMLTTSPWAAQNAPGGFSPQ